MNVTTVPLKRIELSWIVPPIFSTNYLHMLKPRPIPYVDIVVPFKSLIKPNNLKSLSYFSLGIPSPLSEISVCKNPQS